MSHLKAGNRATVVDQDKDGGWNEPNVLRRSASWTDSSTYSRWGRFDYPNFNWISAGLWACNGPSNLAVIA